MRTKKEHILFSRSGQCEKRNLKRKKKEKRRKEEGPKQDKEKKKKMESQKKREMCLKGLVGGGITSNHDELSNALTTRKKKRKKRKLRTVLEQAPVPASHRPSFSSFSEPGSFSNRPILTCIDEDPTHVT
jgi:hypothetical protein